MHMAVVVAAVVDSAELDAELARKAAASLIQPHKTPEKIAEDLLERLQKDTASLCGCAEILSWENIELSMCLKS